MPARASNLKASEHFWAAVVVVVGIAMVLVSLLSSDGVATRLGLGWPTRALLLFGLVVLWGPIILIAAILFAPVFAPVVSSSMVIWRNARVASFVAPRTCYQPVATPRGHSQ